MPTRLCLVETCPNPQVYRGRCREHSRQRERQTHPNKAVYNSKRWKYARRAQLLLEPLCAVCGGIATDVDHIVPIEDGGAVWDPGNHQSLCAADHGRKTKREQGCAA